jgi:hypothetical protein
MDLDIHRFNNVIFYPAVNENGNIMFTASSGGSTIRSDFSFPLGYNWSGITIGNFIENRFFGNICVIYFFGDTGRVTITVNGTNILTNVAVSSFIKVGSYRIFEVPNLNVDYNTVRITVNATTVNVVGMLVHKFNAPFLGFSTSGFNITNNLNSSAPLFSTTTPLSANATVSSTLIDLEQASRTFNWILVTVFANQNGTLHIEFSNDNAHSDAIQTIPYTANTTPYIEPIMRSGRYLKIRYVNGGTAQTVFRLYVRGVSSGF